jgi:uridine kinase
MGVTVLLHVGEPAAGPWRVERISAIWQRIGDRSHPHIDRPVLVAIDGRSSSGKTTLATRVAEVVADTTVVHTDHIAWSHSRFGWSDLALEILEPLHHGESVSFRSPFWTRDAQLRAIDVRSSARFVLVEGVGAARDELAHLFDARLWVQTDRRVTAVRDDERIALGETTRVALDEWMAEERGFVASRRPWADADLIVAGSPDLTHDPLTELVVADGLLRT